MRSPRRHDTKPQRANNLASRRSASSSTTARPWEVNPNVPGAIRTSKVGSAQLLRPRCRLPRGLRQKAPPAGVWRANGRHPQETAQSRNRLRLPFRPAGRNGRPRPGDRAGRDRRQRYHGCKNLAKKNPLRVPHSLTGRSEQAW